MLDRPIISKINAKMKEGYDSPKGFVQNKPCCLAQLKEPAGFGKPGKKCGIHSCQLL